MDLKDKLTEKFKMVDLEEHNLLSPLDVILDYALSVYLKDGEQKDEFSLSKRKEFALNKYKIHKYDKKMFLENRSDLMSSIITEIMKYQNDRKFELYISGLEAYTILLDIVRRPIDDSIDDDKYNTALKAKKQGFMDAKELSKEVDLVLEEMTGMKDSDVGDHIDKESDFRGGLAERYANKAKKK